MTNTPKFSVGQMVTAQRFPGTQGATRGKSITGSIERVWLWNEITSSCVNSYMVSGAWFYEFELAADARKDESLAAAK